MSRAIQMHVHSFGLRFHLRHGAMTVFDYIDHARAEGFTGVNISANGPGFRDLGGTTHRHLSDVRRHLAGMPCELDTSDTRPDHMRRMLEVCATVGADTLRTYTRYTDPLPVIVEQTIADLSAIAPLAGELGVLVVIENHEDLTGPSIAEILRAVDHPWIRALYDYGNSQMVGEHPLDALDAMAPFAARVHAKDHVVIRDGAGTWIQGVPMGSGFLPVIEQTDRLYEHGVRRFCFENVWAYVAPVHAGIDLPSGPAFADGHGHRRLDGDRLAPEVAIVEERAAFRLGWGWFRQRLEEAGYLIGTRA